MAKLCLKKINNKMYTYKAKIIRVIDGDTFEAIIDLGFGVNFTTKLRLAEIDTPETYRPKTEGERAHGEAATAFVKDFIGDGYVTIKTSKQGKYGRYIAYVSVAGEDLTQLLIEHGFEKRDDYV